MSEARPDPSDIEESVRQAVGKKPARWGLESPDELIGTRVDDRYTIVERIAQGGMGAVFKAIQSPMGRVCAVKVLSATYEGRKDPAFDRRFFREAATISRLRHPNTVTLYDYGNIGDLYYMAMEYVDGRTLHAEIHREGPIPERRARRLAAQVCRSLREAHGHGVIHRDLKPDNILLVDRAEEVDLVKVLDFGLAKVIEGELAEEDVTETGLCMGSPKHMAPEQITGDVVSPHTDIYALGILMYEMLTAHSPFDRPTRYQTLVAQVHEEAVPFHKLVPELAISEEMERIVRRCLAKERERRFPSMNDLLQAIKAVERGSRGSMTSIPTATMEVTAGVPSIPPSLVPELSPSQRPSLYPPPSPSSRPPALDPTVEPNAASHRSVPSIPRLPPFRTKEGRSKGLLVGLGVGLAGVILALGAWQVGAARTPRLQAHRALAGVGSGLPLPVASSEPVTEVLPGMGRTVRIETDPPGATVLDGEEPLCEATPCEVRSQRRPHELRVVRRGYAVANVELEEGDDTILIRLVPLGKGEGADAGVAAGEDLAEDTGYKWSPY